MENPKQILETARLKLREFELEDAEFIVELLNSPGWLKYIGDKNIRSSEEARKYLKNGPLKSYQETDLGFWMVELKENKVPIGLCGLIKRKTLDDVDIGFALLPNFAGKSYGFEIAQATLDHAKNELGLKRIVAITLENNIASIELLKKIGLKYEKMVENAGSEAEQLMLFGVDYSNNI